MNDTKTRWMSAALFMLFSMFTGCTHASAQDEFWTWFKANEARLYTFESNREAIFDELSAKMNKVNSDLTFEFGPVEHDGRREFVISAGGIKSAFPAVESLYTTAPALKRWTWIKFRPRRLPLSTIQYGGKTIRPADVGFLMAKDGEKVGIILFFEGYNEVEKAKFGQIGYLFLDQALGEYAVEKQVGFIDFQSRESAYFDQSDPIEELPAQFDGYVGRNNP